MLFCATGTYTHTAHAHSHLPDSCTTALPVACLICAVTHGQLLMHPSTLGPATTDGYRLPVCAHSRGRTLRALHHAVGICVQVAREPCDAALTLLWRFNAAVGTVRHVRASVPTHHGSSVKWGMVEGQLLCPGAAHRCTGWRRLFAGHEEHF